MPKKKRSSSKAKKGDRPQNPALGSKEAQDAFNAVIDALSKWREDIASAADKNASKVTEALASAAQVMGWPEEVVDGVRTQLDKTTELHLQMIEQAMDAWARQVKSPMAPPPGLERFTSQGPILQDPSFDRGKPLSERPHIDPMSALINPMQVWMQTAAFWQNAWLQAFKGLSEMQRSTSTSSLSQGQHGSQ